MCIADCSGAAAVFAPCVGAIYNIRCNQSCTVHHPTHLTALQHCAGCARELVVLRQVPQGCSAMAAHAVDRSRSTSCWACRSCRAARPARPRTRRCCSSLSTKVFGRGVRRGDGAAAYELWFKQILYEVQSVVDIFLQPVRAALAWRTRDQRSALRRHRCTRWCRDCAA